MISRWLGSLVVFVLLFGATTFVQTPDDEAHRLSKELMSPYCPGRTLADCPSPSARVLRDEIEARLEKGETATAIEQDLVSRYGEEMRGTPLAEGFALTLYVALALAALAGLVTVALTVARSLRRAKAAPGPGRAPSSRSDRLNAELDAELVELD